MSNERLGKVIIDGVRLCYIAQPETLESLRCVNIGERVEIGEFSIIRISGLHFQYYFRVLLIIRIVGISILADMAMMIVGIFG